jgi:hypothetical protein
MVWFTLLLFVASFILAAVLAPKPKIENARASGYADVKFPTSSEGNPVPLVYGTVRLRGPNTLWYGDFRAVPVTQKIKTGFFSSKKQITGYKYYIGLQLGLCLGGAVKIKRIWAGKYLAWTGSVSTATTFVIDKPSLFGGDKERGGLSGTVAFYPGESLQVQDSYLLSKIGALVPRYGGICHVVFRSFYIGTTTSLEPFHFELENLPNALALGSNRHIVNGTDSNPVEVLYDAMTNRWGRLGVSSSQIDTANWALAGITCFNEGNGISLTIDRANSGKDICEEVLRQIDGILYQDPTSGLIRMKLIRQDYVEASLTVLDESNVMEIRDFAKQTWSDTNNQTRVTFESRAKDYANASAIAQDFGNINYQNRVKSFDVNFPGVTNATLAQQIATRELAAACVPLFKCRVVCNREASNLRPGDPIVLSWPTYGITSLVMRVQKFDLGELINGKVVLELIQDKFGSSTMVFAPPEVGSWTGVSREPQPITVSRVMETPYWLLQDIGLVPASTAEGRLLSLAAAPTSYSQSYAAYASTDSWATNVEQLEEVTFPATATTTSTFAITAGATNGYETGSGNGFTITGLSDTTVLQTATSAQIKQGTNLVIINDEILAYENYTSLGGGVYRLYNIRRALLDTTYQAHSIGSRVWFLNSSEWVSDNTISDTAAAKIRILDQTDQGSLVLTAVPDTATLTLARRAYRPAPPDYATAAASRSPATQVVSPVVIAWRERNRTNTLIQFEDDVTEAPEASTTYNLQWRLNGGGWTTVVGVTSPYNLVLASPTSGTIDVDVYAVRDSLLSTTASRISFVANIP